MMTYLRILLLFIVIILFKNDTFSQVLSSPGKDGPAVNGSVVNTYYPGVGTVALGATSLTLGTSAGSTTAINKGDLVLIIQMQGANLNTSNNTAYGANNNTATGNLNDASFTAGNYEYALAASNVPTSGGTLTLSSATKYAYSTSDYGATGITGQRRYQVIRVPQYSAITLSAGITAVAWNGTIGGVIAMDVAGQLNFNGQTISAVGAGFRGGAGRTLAGAAGLSNQDYRTLSTQTANAQKGEGTAGTPANVFSSGALLNTGVEGYVNGSMGRGAPGNAGGGGNDANPTANDQNTGGGGGANGGAGGKGGNSWSSNQPVGGLGGAGFGVVAPGRLVLGGGGGAGTTNNGSGNIANGLASSGEAGGGLIMVRAGTITGTGTINANGNNANNTVTGDGSGGGGAGGSVLLTAASGGLTTITVTAKGGNGGSNTGGGSAHGPGGGGGGGVIYASSPLASGSNAAGGANGQTLTGTNSATAYGALAGSGGVLNTAVTATQLTNSSVGASSLPNLTVTKSTTTPIVYRLASGTQATYTITVNNSGGTAQGIRITDALPANFTYNSTVSINLGTTSNYDDVGLTATKALVLSTSTATINPAAGTSTPVWGTFSIPSGGSVQITFKVDISNSAALNTAIQNSTFASFLDPTRTSFSRLVTLDAVSTDPNKTYETGANAGADVPGSNYSSSSTTNEDVTVKLPADVAVTNTVSASPYFVGQNVTYTIKVKNNSSVGATGVVVNDKLPAGLTFVSSTTVNGTYNASTGDWAIGSIPANTEYTLTIVATPNVSGNITTTATKTAQTEPDEVSTNNTASNTISVATPADVAVTNTVAAGPYYNGVNTTFTITATNNGPNTATGINILDKLPAGLDLIEATASTGTYNSTNGNWAITTLANGATATLTLLVKPNTTGTINTNATKNAANEYDNNAVNNSADANITVFANADLVVTNTVAPGPYYRNVQTTYTVTVNNTGPDDATGVTLKDLFPSNLTYNSSTPASGTTYNSSTGIWTIGSLAKGTTLTLIIKATPTNTNSVTTTASINSQDQYDAVAANNSASNTINPNPASDIAITNTVTAGPYYNGVNTTFTITARNNGLSNATNVSVIDQLPSGLQLISATSSEGTFDPASGIWAIGNLLANAQVTLDLIVKPIVTGTISTTASKYSANEYDKDTSNDQAVRSITVGANADLAVTNTVTAGPYVVGTDVTYTVTVTNNGPDATTNVNITDLLPAGLSYKSYTATAGTYTSGNGVWAVGSLASGAAQTLTLVATPNTTDIITTTASVTNSSIYDSQSANNMASNSIGVNAKPVADIAITNTVAAGTHYNNVPTTFTVTAKNNGPDATSGVQVTDLLPAGLTFISAVPSVGTYNSTTGVWNIGNIASGITQTLKLTVVPNTTGNVVMVATKTAQATTEDDNVASNDSDEEAITVIANADLSVEMMVGNGPFYVGDYPVFTIKVRNSGPNLATNIRIFDNRPTTFDLNTFSAITSSGTYSSSSGYWDIPSLAAGQEVTMTIKGRVNRSGSITFRVDKTFQDQHDSNPNNNLDFASFAVSPSADIAITNTVSAGPYLNGKDVVYTVGAKNLGPSPASGVQVTDKLPAGLTIIEVTPSVGTYDAGTGIWDINNIALGATQTLTIVARPTGSGFFTTTVSKTAQTETDRESTNNVASNVIEVGTSADLAGTFNVSPGPYYNGITTTVFTGTVTNNGPDAATGVVYYDNRPSTLNFSFQGTPVASKGNYDPATGYWNIGTLAVGETVTLTVNTKPIKTGNITISATKTGQTNADLVPANDNGAVMINVQKAADIALSSTQANGPYFVDQATTYTITATNNGADDATSVATKHTLPAGLKLIKANPSVGTFDVGTGIWTIGDLAKNAASTITFTVVPTTTGTLTAQSEKSAGTEYDVNTGNNSVNTIFNDVLINRPAVYTVAPAKNVDAYVNNQSLAKVADPDGAITAAEITNGTLPPGVAFNAATGEFTVLDKNLLVAGSYTLEVKTTDQTGGISTNTVSLLFMPDTEAGATVFAAKNFYDYRNNDILANFTDDDGFVRQTTLLSGILPNGVTMPDGHIIVNDRLLIRPGSYPITVRTQDETGGISEKSITLTITEDRDGDGVKDFDDIDNNNDGITDVISGSGFNPYGDHDNDGHFNYYDPNFVHTKYGIFRDVNSDQINDWFDLDLDGIINNLDLDMDGDGIANTREANRGIAPADYNTIISKYNGIEGNNGMPDYAETSPESGITNLPMPDTDGDSYYDFLDIDADNDGIIDNIEAQTTDSYRPPSQIDDDRDGLVNNYDGNEGGQALIAVNTDAGYAVNDTMLDYLDLDADNDKSPDFYEAFDINHDKKALDNLMVRAQIFENATGKNYYLNLDNNNHKDTDQVPDWLEIAEGNTRPNYLTPGNAYYHDSDRDGLVDLFDPDNNGVIVRPSRVSSQEADFRSEENIVVLPVVLIRFSATQQAGKVQLKWATASEQNNRYFNVERSSDGVHFTVIGQVEGAGNSIQLTEYEFIDEEPGSGIVYYRLQQIDVDGKSKYSNIIWTDIKQSEPNTATIYPNPFQNQLKLAFHTSSAGEALVTILDAKGQQVKSLRLQVKAGANTLNLYLSDLASGMYILRLESAGTRIIRQIIKE